MRSPVRDEHSVSVGSSRAATARATITIDNVVTELPQAFIAALASQTVHVNLREQPSGE
jgi:hypothetical protein